MYMQAFIIANSFLNIIASGLDSEKGYNTSGVTNAVVSVLAFRKYICCIVDGYYCCVFDRHCLVFSFFSARLCYVLYGVTSLFYGAECSSFCNWCYLFSLPFLRKQTRHGRNIVSFYFLLFICGRAKCLSPKQFLESSVKVDALCYNGVCRSFSKGDQQLSMMLDVQC
jgi:hypothetical protein